MYTMFPMLLLWVFRRNLVHAMHFHAVVVVVVVVVVLERVFRRKSVIFMLSLLLWKVCFT